MGDTSEELGERLVLIAKRIEDAGLVRAAEDVRKVADELRLLTIRVDPPRPVPRA